MLNYYMLFLLKRKNKLPILLVNNKLNEYEVKEALYSSLFKKCYQPEDIKDYVVSRKLKRYITNFNLSMKPNANLFINILKIV